MLHLVITINSFCMDALQFDIPSEKVTEVHPNRPLPPPPSAAKTDPALPKSGIISDDIPSTSA